MTNINRLTMAEHFGWQMHPFSDTWRLDPPFYTQRDQRIAEQTLSLLQHGKSLAITGASGTGKSTLIEHILSNLDTNYYQPLHIHYGGLQRTSILKALAEKIGVETTGRSVPLLVKLQKHIATLTAGSQPVYPVIWVDDAQLLERESFMDLCSLIVCPPKKTTAASLIIVGDDLLTQKLSLAIMKPIRTRLTVNFRMEPLTEKETQQFVAFRVQSAGAPKDLFEPETLSLMASHCHGNRREIMNIGTLLLSEAYYRKEKTVNAQLFSSSELLN